MLRQIRPPFMHAPGKRDRRNDEYEAGPSTLRSLCRRGGMLGAAEKERPPLLNNPPVPVLLLSSSETSRPPSAVCSTRMSPPSPLPVSSPSSSITAARTCCLEPRSLFLVLYICDVINISACVCMSGGFFSAIGCRSSGCVLVTSHRRLGALPLQTFNAVALPPLVTSSSSLSLRPPTSTAARASLAVTAPSAILAPTLLPPFPFPVIFRLAPPSTTCTGMSVCVRAFPTAPARMRVGARSPHLPPRPATPREPSGALPPPRMYHSVTPFCSGTFVRQSG